MNNLCYELLTGTLPALSQTPTSLTGNITNPLATPILVTMLNPQTTISISGGMQGSIVAPGSTVVLDDSGPSLPTYCAITVPGTGSLIDVFELSSATSGQTFTPQLSAPNDIGPIPVPSASRGASAITPQPTPAVPDSTVIVPPDSARVLVGCGALNGKVITREQYWERQGTSICLAGRESRTVSLTTTEGKQQTSSTMETVEASLGASVSGGWGPISASISASLSTNSSSFQQVTVTEETTTYVSHTIRNPNKEPIMYLRWQLIDVITIFAVNGPIMLPEASIVTAEDPMIVMGPYWVQPTRKPGDKTSDADLGLFEYS